MAHNGKNWQVFCQLEELFTINSQKLKITVHFVRQTNPGPITDGQ